MRVLPGSPELVRSAARTLQARSDALEAQGRQVVGAADGAGSGWDGAASLAFEAVAHRAGRACVGVGGDLNCLAAAGRGYAQRLEAAQGQLADLARAEAEAIREEAALQMRAQAIAAPLGYGWGGGQAADAAAGREATARARASLDAEVERVRALRARLAAAADDVVARHEGERAAFIAALGDSDPLGGLDAFVGVGHEQGELARQLLDDGKDVWTKAKHTRTLFVELAVAGALRPGPSGGAFAAGVPVSRKFASTLAELRGKPLPGAGALRSAPVGAGRAAASAAMTRINLVGTLAEGGKDLLQGDPDHPGWRDTATRIMGGVGAGGAAVLLLPASACPPLGLAIGAGAVTAYGAYKLGTAVYDHREDIARAATTAWRAADDLRAAGSAAVAEGVSRACEGVGRVGADLTQGVRRLFGAPRWGW